MFFIYKATNIVNGKAYVGFTAAIEKRKKEHHCEAFSRNSNFLFHKALRKYGWDAFRWDIVEQHENKEYLLLVRESEVIKLENTHVSVGGYNLTFGGDGTIGFKFSPEQKLKLRNSHLGKKHSVASKAKLRLSHTGRKNTLAHNLNIAKAFAQSWLVKRPDGSEIRVVNLKRFCILEGLRYAGFHKVATGVISHHKGYKVTKETTPCTTS